MTTRAQDDLYRAILAALRKRRARIRRRLDAVVMERVFDHRVVSGLLRQHDEINAALRLVARVARQQQKGRR